MAYTKVNYEDVDPVAESMHFLRDALDCETVGVTVLECEPGWSGKAHDHAEENHEEVYLLVDGEATVTIEGQDVAMESGDAVRVAPEATREIHNGDAESKFVLVGAP
ncbi:ureidoglycine aminohydrolase protein [Halorhabdus tiamatea SARL4B]|nr:cupin domain-containing protein [Halorhabdus tiamatea]ERJ06297.1 ureidoglycine aminohydrolase protein [Halorhabdus tiamatea SARL4B]